MKSRIQIYFFISCIILPFVATFSWHNCGNSTQSVKIFSLEAFTNNTETLYLTARGTVGANITSPIKGDVDMHKKFFWGWSKIPCVARMGSCTYEDLCKLSPYVSKPCPVDLVADDLPCKCPILKGKFKINRFPIEMGLLPPWVKDGKYRIKVSLHQSEKQLMCLLFYIDI